MGSALSKREGLEQLELLLQSAGTTGISRQELAEKLGVDRSTVHRWMDDLTDWEEVQPGHFRSDPTKSLQNVRLHPNEALAIYLALRRIIRHTNKAPGFMLTALQKITPALRRADLIEPLNQSIDDLRQHRKSAPDDAKIWDDLLRGWIDHRVVKIEYQKLEHESESRLIEPYLFEPMLGGDGNYLIAWCRERDDLRTFKVDRIRRTFVTSESYAPRSISINDLLKKAWGIHWGDSVERVELLFDARAAERVVESIYHPTETRTLLPDGRLLWTANLAVTKEILPWIRSWAAQVIVLAPLSLRQTIIDDARALLSQYEQSND